jgi:hypothetical protein
MTLAALTLVLGGCALRPGTPLDNQLAGAGGVQNPFAAASLQIHPLTRVDRDAKGQLWIICHIELRDAWGDTTKGTGDLQVHLLRPTGGRASGLGTQEMTWEVNLSDLDTNASLYDPATRTYRLPLEGAPAWVTESTDGERDLPLVRLRAYLTTFGPRGDEVTLEDEFGIGG